MFNLTSIIRSNKNLVVTGLVAASFVFGSVSAQAIELDSNDLIMSVEKNITDASKDILANAKQEFLFSLKNQISQQFFDTKEQTQTVKINVKTPASVSQKSVALDSNDLVAAVEKNITAANQDILANAKQEFILSLKEQISQQVFDTNEQTETVQNDVKAPVLVSQQTEAK
jgi:ribosomal protein L17